MARVSIEILSGAYSGRVFFRELPLLIGRALVESDKVLDLEEFDQNSMVSQNHCEILQQDSEYILVDLGSANGTHIFKNGKLCSLSPNVPERLKNNDLFVVGEFLLRFKVES